MTGVTKILVDHKEIEVPPEYSLLQACEEAGAEIPRFCFHDRLSVAGNCRMCLIEVKGGPPKPVASCAMNVRDLRPGPEGQLPEIFTTSPMVKKAREGVMEFLLINHPLDCPICDQGGECDLQDQAMAYGVDASRFAENKRAVTDKYIGPLVKTIMTRCIHCTRCVRFTTEVAGVSELGLLGRGEDAEITTYLESSMTSELQGNVIDLCPVGALTSKPYSFQARPWELNKTETVDVMDALGSSIRVDTRGREVLRIMPILNDAVNEEWISDKSRFVWDGLRTQRLDQPYIKKEERLVPATWDEAFDHIAMILNGVDGKHIGAIAGDLASVEEMFALKMLMQKLNSPNLDCRQDGSALDPKFGRASFLFNPSIQGIEEADAILMIGANPRKEAAVLNARIRKRWRQASIPIGLVGEKISLTYDYDYLGSDTNTIKQLVSGQGEFYEKLKTAKKPILIIGHGALCRADGLALLSSVAKIATNIDAVGEDWNGFAVLHTAAARVGGLELGFVPMEGGKNTAEMISAISTGDIKVLFLLGADEVKVPKAGDAVVVYIGSHGDEGAQSADVVLPGATYTEKNGMYLNTEGRVQLGFRAAFPPGEGREDWAILRALSAKIGKQLEFDSLSELREKIFLEYPDFHEMDSILPTDFNEIKNLAKMNIDMNGTDIKYAVSDFYLTNPIARASAVMAECSAMTGKQVEVSTT